MAVTQYSNINELIDQLLLRMKSILGEKLVGLYLEGSLIIGDFDPNISDIDLVAALSADIDDRKFEALQKMHQDFATAHQEWDDRIEVCYITVDALKTVKSRTTMIVNISPGEPFHRVESNKEWLMNWYITRERSKTLFGPEPKTIIEAISKEEFIHAVQEHAKKWTEYIKDTEHARKKQAYAILTMCRALYAYKNGDQVSKKRAALWVQKQLPEWSSLIQNALLWREEYRNEQVDHEATYPETVKFVNDIIERIEI